MKRATVVALSGMNLLLACHHAIGVQARSDLAAGFVIDVSPLEKVSGMLDFKIKVTCKTAKGDVFDRGVTVKGPATETIADSVLLTLDRLYQAHQWEIRSIEKNKLLVIGKKGSPIEKMEIKVEGLEKKYHPVFKQIKAK